MLYEKKSQIYKRLLRIVVISVVLCIFLGSGAVYFYLKPLVEKTLMEKNRNMIVKMGEEMWNSLEEISLYAQNIAFDDTIQNSLYTAKEQQKGSYAYYSCLQTLEKKLQEYRMLRADNILGIFVTTSRGEVLETMYQYEGLVTEEPYKDVIGEECKGCFLPEHSVNYYGSYGLRKTISYVNSIYNKEKIGEEEGKLVILLDAEQVSSILSFDEEEVKVKLYDGDDRLIYSNTDTDLGKNRAKNYKDYVGGQGWYISYEITMQSITDTINQMNTVVILIMCLSLVIMLILVTGLVRKIVGPLETLIQGMRRVAEGSRKERIILHTGDECEVAANVFNSMVESINHHTEELLDSEKKQYESQIKMLSYQLNPHFIYNTLNAVICLARREDYKEIISLTRSLIAILQSILKTDLQAVTTIREEKEFVDRYVRILQICYHNVPDVQWQISDELYSIHIPRLILYPLVENSIFHGIVPSEHASYLGICIERETNWIKVTVEDDGTGCEQEKLEDIRKRLAKGKTEGHIGLYNVNGRLKLIYKESKSLVIQNRDKGGTRISFSYRIS